MEALRSSFTLGGMRTLLAGTVLGFSLLSLLSGCGDTKPGSMVKGGGASGGSASGGGASGGSGHQVGASGSQGSLNLSGGNGPLGSGGGVAGAEGCAASTQEAGLAPVYLVFLLDESGSMGDKPETRTQKWDPVTSALQDFFADPQSQGLTASLSIFPLDQNKTMGAANDALKPSCTAADYAPPIVPPTALPEAKLFLDAIAAITPPNENGTPTLPALTGTIDYAQGLLKQDPLRKVAIVLVTDGEPSQCDGNTVDNIAAAAGVVKAQIPTYVIGVGSSLVSLNAIAVGGGTDKAFIVAVNDPAKTRTDFLSAVNIIRGRSISCDIPLPPPPLGKKLDPKKVNVQLSGTGQPTDLKYGADCTGDAAWHYDDPLKPTKVLLCESACTAAKTEAAGRLDVVFGCVDRSVN